jgi:hypothetical protein
VWHLFSEILYKNKNEQFIDVPDNKDKPHNVEQKQPDKKEYIPLAFI